MMALGLWDCVLRKRFLSFCFWNLFRKTKIKTKLSFPLDYKKASVDVIRRSFHSNGALRINMVQRVIGFRRVTTHVTPPRGLKFSQKFKNNIILNVFNFVKNPFSRILKLNNGFRNGKEGM